MVVLMNHENGFHHASHAVSVVVVFKAFESCCD